jgi:AmiR/NasT family two-component response regulator
MTRSAPTKKSQIHDGADEFAALLSDLASARGCALFEARHGQQTLVRRASAGDRPPDLDELGYDDLGRLDHHKNWATLPYYTDGLISAVLILVFDNEKAKNEAKPVLRRIVPLFETLAHFVNSGTRQVKLAAKISELEASIAAEKIMDRARGLLKEHPQLNETTIERVDRHVAKVLASLQFSQDLEGRLRDLEGRAAERDLAARAKVMLQERRGLSEEEAYLHIRTISRQQRKRIAEVAREILQAELPSL